MSAISSSSQMNGRSAAHRARCAVFPVLGGMTGSVVATCDDLDMAQGGVQVAVERGLVVCGRGLVRGRVVRRWSAGVLVERLWWGELVAAAAGARPGVEADKSSLFSLIQR